MPVVPTLKRKFHSLSLLCYSLFMGNMDVPSQRGPIKCPMGTYEFGANVINEKVSSIANEACFNITQYLASMSQALCLICWVR